MKTKTRLLLLVLCLLIVAFSLAIFANNKQAQNVFAKIAVDHTLGDAVDSLNGVKIYYNGAVANTGERHLAEGGYNYGLRWQCVEFVKRYYHDHLDHKMPDTYGHAKDFFDAAVADGKLNKKRNLLQYKNGSATKPAVNDLLVFDSHSFNPYGHVAIISKVSDDEIEMAQQNPGPTAPSRETYSLEKKNGKWTIGRSDLLGWLRVE